VTAPPVAVQLSRVGQIAIPVNDLERAVRFYRNTLGLRYLFTAGQLAFFDCGGVRLMLDVPEQPEVRSASSVIYYIVDDIQRAYATLRDRGATFEDTPHVIAKLPDHDLWMTFLRDPDHNLLALMSEVPR